MVDAVVVGAGPNGLAAAIELARNGRSVHLIEGQDSVGGGTRTAELTLPGFRHDICSAVHPLAVGSPFLSALPLQEHGLELIEPSVQAAHPLDDGSAAILMRSLEETADSLGADARAYRSLMRTFASHWDRLAEFVLAPLTRPPHAPLLAARFGSRGALPATLAARARFRTPQGRALLAGMAAHSMRPLDAPATTAFALVMLSLGHACGWPVARRGSGEITLAMARYLESLGGTIELGRPVSALAELPDSRAVLFDVTPRQLLEICGDQLPSRYRRALARFRYGAGVFKIDYALSGPLPWKAPGARAAGTVHLGGTLEEIAASEKAVHLGEPPQRPYVLIAQQSLADPTRAPAGQHTLWAYCHVPNGSSADMTEAIERQIERFAPGFGDLVLARETRSPKQLEAENPNCIGGDIGGGATSLWQTLARPALRANPYRTPNERILICSASTPPGGGVHGMCGFHAARSALRGPLR
ncbi:MAG TPA: NAD(P)/FAD-dependent oxidoreductase [Solirubrobacteraceae bacterium]|nr:NAD(P)/FAD-dependent oxidoreductase [Solirubrobacteraceae bacterium]